MRDRLLKSLLYLLGGTAIVIGLSILTLGAHATAAATERLVDLAFGKPFDGGEPFSPTADSELRFYAPFWMVYGGVLIHTTNHLSTHRHWVIPLAALFWAGGIGRLLAYFAGGPPRLPFVLLMGVELTLPLVLSALAGWQSRKTEGV